MTTPSSTDHAAAAEATTKDDQQPAVFQYGHGRMPFFMKLVWLGFLAFSAWYVVTWLLTALGEEVA